MLPDHLYPANVRPNSLPETWYGYDSVKLLILRPETIRQLRDSSDTANLGRDHWARAMCAMMAGGATRCGQVIGATDDKAMAAIWVANFILMKQRGYVPARDIIVALTAERMLERARPRARANTFRKLADGIILADGAMHCWGYNASRQLGQEGGVIRWQIRIRKHC